MNKLTILISACTAFIIGSGLALGAVLAGGPPTKWQVVIIIFAGLTVAAKDTRSLLKLPPVNEETFDSKPFSGPMPPPFAAQVKDKP